MKIVDNDEESAATQRRRCVANGDDVASGNDALPLAIT